MLRLRDLRPLPPKKKVCDLRFSFVTRPTAKKKKSARDLRVLFRRPTSKKANFCHLFLHASYAEKERSAASYAKKKVRDLRFPYPHHHRMDPATGEYAAEAGDESNAWNDNLSDFGEAEETKPPAASDGWGNDDWDDDDDDPPPKAPEPKPEPEPKPKKTLSKSTSLGSSGGSAASLRDKKDSSPGMELKKKPVKKSLGAKKVATD